MERKTAKLARAIWKEVDDKATENTGVINEDKAVRIISKYLQSISTPQPAEARYAIADKQADEWMEKGLVLIHQLGIARAALTKIKNKRRIPETSEIALAALNEIEATPGVATPENTLPHVQAAKFGKDAVRLPDLETSWTRWLGRCKKLEDA